MSTLDPKVPFIWSVCQSRPSDQRYSTLKSQTVENAFTSTTMYEFKNKLEGAGMWGKRKKMWERVREEQK